MGTGYLQSFGKNLELSKGNALKRIEIEKKECGTNLYFPTVTLCFLPVKVEIHSSVWVKHLRLHVVDAG